MSASKPEPLPQKGKLKVLDFVVQDFKDRAAFGFKKYQTYLETNNGRDALIDAYQEAIDLVMYLRQAILEREMKGL
jgi:hypothetical protein